MYVQASAFCARFHSVLSQLTVPIDCAKCWKSNLKTSRSFFACVAAVGYRICPTSSDCRWRSNLPLVQWLWSTVIGCQLPSDTGIERYIKHKYTPHAHTHTTPKTSRTDNNSSYYMFICWPIVCSTALLNVLLEMPYVTRYRMNSISCVNSYSEIYPLLLHICKSNIRLQCSLSEEICCGHTP